MPPPPTSQHPPARPPDRRTIGWFAAFALAAIGFVILYALVLRPAPDAPARGTTAVADPAALDAVRLQSHVLFRNTILGPSYGRVGLVPAASPRSDRVITDLACERVYATADRGLCLQAARGVLTTYQAISFDRRFVMQHSFNLPGTPSRTRVAPQGPLAVSTVFVSGDSYAGGSFSTRTSLFDLASNRTVGDLEQFTVTRDGTPFKEQDFNFWGVTFAADGDRFYATLATQGTLHLVEGRVSTKSMQVVRQGVECPSLSPDGTRLVYKSRRLEGGRLFWRLKVVELGTGREVELSETRSVDDQAEWLDTERVLYALPRGTTGSGSSDVWSARADGTGTPELFIPDAYSPAVVRASR
jgi:hypothetical protein